MLTRFPSLPRRDEGSTLVSVLIIMLVLTIGGLALATVVVNTSGIVTGSRDTAESRAAADAGLADVSVRVQQGDIVCDPAAAPPAPVASAPGLDVTYGVTISCAEDIDGRQTLTLTSTGLGANGSSTTTTATYGPGLAGALTTMTGGLSLSSAGSQADGNVLVNDGFYHCDGTAIVSESVVVRNGDAKLSNNCGVKNTVIASAGVGLDNGANVGGDVYALGGNFSIDQAPTVVGGNVYVDGNALLNSGHIKGSVTATGNVTIAAGAKVDGGVHAGGVITVATTTTISPLRSAVADGSAPPVISPPWQMAPSAFEWVDVNYTPPAAGESPAVTTCPPMDTTATIAGFSSFTSPQIIDWRHCTADVNFYQNPVVLNTDLTIYLNRTVYLNGVVVSSGNGANHQFNLVMPDLVADGAPSGPCPAGVRLDINNLQMTDEISGAAYSPCSIDLGGTKWNGIIYGHRVSSFNGSKLTYKDLTLPNGDKLRAPLGPIIDMKDVG